MTIGKPVVDNPLDTDTAIAARSRPSLLAAMSYMRRPLLSVVLVLATAPLLAQQRTPASTITNATWPEYRSSYLQSPLCSKDEITLWTCGSGKRVYSLCSSQFVTRTSGYMQYRASRDGKVVFTYPTEKKPPLGSFVYDALANGDAYIEFTNNGYEYTIFDPLRDASFIRVWTPSGKGNDIRCGGTQTLQVNYTMRLMYESGVWSGY